MINHYAFSEIKLSDSNGAPKFIQVMRTGKFTHPVYGKIEITPARIQNYKKNFDNKVRRIDIAVDYFHENERVAAGWFKSTEVRDDGNELWAEIDWCPKGAQKIAEKELRYFSPEFASQLKDAETGEVFNDVLLGGGLTNRPFLKDMNPITLLSEIDLHDLATFLAERKKLNEANAAGVCPPNSKQGDYKMDEKDKMIEQLKAEIAELKAKLEGTGGVMEAMDAEKKALSEKVTKLESEKKLAEKEAKFTALLSEGKACAAQKDAFIKGDMDEFLAKAQKVNLSENGNAGSAGNETIDSKNAADKVMKLAEEKMKADGKLDLGKAVTLVLSENKELAALYN